MFVVGDVGGGVRGAQQPPNRLIPPGALGSAFFRVVFRLFTSRSPGLQTQVLLIFSPGDVIKNVAVKRRFDFCFYLSFIKPKSNIVVDTRGLLQQLELPKTSRMLRDSDLSCTSTSGDERKGGAAAAALLTS